jgi:hypothetical protein
MTIAIRAAQDREPVYGLVAFDTVINTNQRAIDRLSRSGHFGAHEKAIEERSQGSSQRCRGFFGMRRAESCVRRVEMAALSVEVYRLSEKA